MGKHSTGAKTTGEITKIDLSYLLKQGYIKKGSVLTDVLHWTNGSNIAIKTSYTESEKYIHLIYSTTNKQTNETLNFNYKIQLTTINSNLGKGEIIYFVCPETKKLCRILYKTYNSEIWKCRTAYTQRIYYALQQSSRLNKNNDRYWQLKKRLEKFNTKIVKTHYKGKPTRTNKKIDLLVESIEKHDFLRWTILPKSIEKYAIDFLT